MKRILTIATGVAAMSLAACSGGSVQSSLQPNSTTTDPLAGSTLQFAIGTANIAGTIGLNSLATLRQTGANAGTSVLSNAPTIVGPVGFAVPALGVAPDAFLDAGTNHISGFVPTSLASPPPQTTFDPNAGASAQGNYLVSSYGIFPGVSANSGDTPSLQPGAMPFYSTNNPTLAGVPIQYIGGPPAFIPPGHTSTQDGTFPSGYPGYTLGFADFQAPPVSGVYTLNVQIPTGINSSGASSFGTKTATATLAAGTVLPPWAVAPTFLADGTGGGTITTNFAGGGGATEEFLEIVNTGPGTCNSSTGSAPFYYTFRVTPGAATVAVPDNLGAAAPGKAQPHTFCTAAENGVDATGAAIGPDTYMVYGFAVDYPLQESAFPASDGVANPTITTGAQDDVTTSPAGPPMAAAMARARYKALLLHRRH